ncbi:hypothetical protein [Corallococcus terminator]|uniref:Lipoprotein n=1 Tax=Corallococcus terminator TaxID=2316733 RepID=A0A3A8JRE1_9BACT|nr:hypothetical protein [Corallococcus terminator]RKG92233.1 hypothetical protein D7V88_06775 [Corallococcus terminator]
MRPLATTTWLLFALFALGGCNRLQPDSPVGAYQTFHRHVQRGELPKAYAVLSQPTQTNLKAQAQKVSDASGGMVKPEPLALFFANVPVPPDVQEVSLLRQEGDEATLVVRSAGRSGEVRMVREPSGWKVDLSASPQP